MGDVNTNTLLPPSLQNNSLVKILRDTYTSFSQRREALGLSNPGAVEKIKREVDSDVLLSKHMFSGLRADVSRPLSMMPMFQYSHTFALGSQIPPYGFSALFGTPKVCRQTCLQQVHYLEAMSSQADTLSHRYSCKETLIMRAS